MGFSNNTISSKGGQSYAPQLRTAGTYKSCKALSFKEMPSNSKAAFVLEWQVPGRTETIQDFIQDNTTQARWDFTVSHLKELYKAIGKPLKEDHEYKGAEVAALFNAVVKDKTVVDINVSLRPNPNDPSGNNPYCNIKFLSPIRNSSNTEAEGEVEIEQVSLDGLFA